ncbi:Obg family GTPase CgtA, partial [Clostridium sporogenes]
VLKNKGVMEELMKMGIEDGDVVRLNDFEFDFLL